MKTNIKTIKIIIPNEIILNRINTTPTLKRLSKLNLIVGENEERVNHFQFAEMNRIFPILGIQLIDLTQERNLILSIDGKQITTIPESSFLKGE